MRRIFSVFLIVIISSFSLFSHISSISVGTLNDAFTFGIAENYDDLRSYGFISTLETSSHWKSTILLSGITFRNNAHPSSGSRVDEIYLNVGKELPLYFVLNRTNFITAVTLSGGLYIVGDLGFSIIQNRWHEMTHIQELYLPYCNENSVSIYPHVGLASRFSLVEKIPYYSFTSLIVEVEGDVKFSPLYKTSYAMGLSISQFTALDSYFKVGAGFTQAFSLHRFPLLETTAASESGIYVDFTGRLGLLQIKYRLYTHTSRAYGGVIIGLYNSVSQRDHYYSTNDLMFSVGSELSERPMFTLAIRYAITPSLGVYLSNVFGTKILEYNQHTRQNTTKLHIGVDYELDAIKNDIMLPFVSAGAGFRRVLVTKDGDEDQQRVSVFQNHSFLLNTQLGVRFFDDGRFKLGSTIYGLSLSAGVSVAIGKDIEDEISLHHLILMDSFQPFVRISVFSAGSL